MERLVFELPAAEVIDFVSDDVIGCSGFAGEWTGALGEDSE